MTTQDTKESTMEDAKRDNIWQLHETLERLEWAITEARLDLENVQDSMTIDDDGIVGPLDNVEVRINKMLSALMSARVSVHWVASAYGIKL